MMIDRFIHASLILQCVYAVNISIRSYNAIANSAFDIVLKLYIVFNQFTRKCAIISAYNLLLL